MLISPTQILPTGKTISLSLAEEWAVAALKESLGCDLSALDGKMVLNCDAGRFETEIQMTISISRPCDRCLGEVSYQTNFMDRLVYLPEVDSKENSLRTEEELDSIEDEIRLSSKDMDIGWYTGKLDLAQLLIDACMLSFPQRFFCEMDGVRRKTSGKCIEFVKDDAPRTHTPFANLKFL
jgi:uncharacterized metal-binding protein YceD (DUF177 family)